MIIFIIDNLLSEYMRLLEYTTWVFMYEGTFLYILDADYDLNVT